MNNEEIVQRALEGDVATAKWAIPRVVKIFVAATRGGKYIRVDRGTFDSKRN